MRRRKRSSTMIAVGMIGMFALVMVYSINGIPGLPDGLLPSQRGQDEGASTPTTLTTAGGPQPAAVGFGTPLGFAMLFADVGHGDATLIAAPGEHFMLVDAGPDPSLIRQRMEALAIGQLDAIVATHADPEHIAGFIEVIESFDVLRFYWNGVASPEMLELGEAIGREGADVIQLRRGDTIPLGDLEIHVLHPVEPLSGNADEDSVVLRVGCGETSVMLMADTQVGAEVSMMGASVLSDVDVLKVGDHGARTSTSLGLLLEVTPEWGIISAGMNSPSGDPDEDLLRRLAESQVFAIHTDFTEGDDGIILTSDCSRIFCRRILHHAGRSPANGGDAMEPRLSMITLGVSDLRRSVAFYRDGLGLPLREGSTDEVAFFETSGTWLGLYPAPELANDANVSPEGQGFRAFSIAHNVRTREEVDQVLSQATEAGATLSKPAAETEWGGYSGYFANPDGFLWEVAWNSHFWVGG